MNDDIHLSLSPTGSPAPNDDEVFEDIDLNSSQQTTNNTNNKNTDNNIPDGFKIGYRDTKSVPVRSSSWYDGFLQCFKPVMTSFMGKGKPSNSESDAQGMKFCMETWPQSSARNSYQYAIDYNILNQNHVFFKIVNFACKNIGWVEHVVYSSTIIKYKFDSVLCSKTLLYKTLLNTYSIIADENTNEKPLLISSK